MGKHFSTAAAVLSVLLFVPPTAAAQQLGVKGGVTLTDVRWGEAVEITTKRTPGFLAGAFTRVKPLKGIDLQIEAVVSQIVIDFAEADIVLKNTLTVVDVPVLVRYKLFSGKNMTVRAQGGAAFDLVVMARENVNGETADIKETVAPWGAALVAAAEVEWGRRWVFDARYVFGLTNIYEEQVAIDFPAKNQSIQVTAGFKIR